MVTPHSCFDQFEIIRVLKFHPFGNFDISITNSTIFLILPALYIVFLYNTNIKKGLLVPGRYQSLLEVFYEIWHSLIKDNIGQDGYRFFPFMLTLGLFIITINLFGLIPYTFTPTTHIAMTFTLSFAIFLTVNFIGFSRYPTTFVSFLMPAGAPLGMAPFLVLIELCSHTAKALTLGLRLAANMIGGHLLLNIISGFAWQMLTCGIFTITLGAIIPIFVGLFVCVLEIGVACIQAYVFCLLTVIYLNEGLNLH
jgi:ATP synthase subunit 6